MRPPQFKVAEQSHVRYAVRVKIGIRVAKGACLGSKESLSNHPSSAQCTLNMAYSESFDMLAMENKDTTSREAWVKTAFHSFRQEQPRVGIGPGSANGGAARTYKVSVGCCTHSACFFGASQCSCTKNTGYVRMIRLDFSF